MPTAQPENTCAATDVQKRLESLLAQGRVDRADRLLASALPCLPAHVARRYLRQLADSRSVSQLRPIERSELEAMLGRHRRIHEAAHDAPTADVSSLLSLLPRADEPADPASVAYAAQGILAAGDEVLARRLLDRSMAEFEGLERRTMVPVLRAHPHVSDAVTPIWAQDDGVMSLERLSSYGGVTTQLTWLDAASTAYRLRADVGEEARVVASYDGEVAGVASRGHIDLWLPRLTRRALSIDAEGGEDLRRAVLSLTGRFLALPRGERGWVVRELPSGAQLGQFDAETTTAFVSLADGAAAAAVGDATQLSVLDWRTGQRRSINPLNSRALAPVAVAPGGDAVVTLDQNLDYTLWRVPPSAAPAALAKVHPHLYGAPSIFPVAAARTFEELIRHLGLQGPSPIVSSTNDVSPDCWRDLADGSRVFAWVRQGGLSSSTRPAERQPVGPHRERRLGTCAISASGHTGISSDFTARSRRLTDLASGVSREVLPFPPVVVGEPLLFPRSDVLAVLSGQGVYWSSAGDNTGRFRYRVLCPYSSFVHAPSSPTALMAVHCADGHVDMVRLLGGAGVHELAVVAGTEEGPIALSADGETFARAGKDGVRWKRSADEGWRELPAGSGGCVSLALSPNGSAAACLDSSGGLKTLDLASGGVLWAASGPYRRGSLQWSADGRVVGLVGSSILLFDAATGRSFTSFEYEGALDSWSFSSDGGRVAAAFRQQDSQPHGTSFPGETFLGVFSRTPAEQGFKVVHRGHGYHPSLAFAGRGAVLLSPGRHSDDALGDWHGASLELRDALSGEEIGRQYLFPDGSFVTMSRTGHVDASDSAAGRLLECGVGGSRVDFSVCAERYLVPGLMTRLLTGDFSFLEP